MDTYSNKKNPDITEDEYEDVIVFDVISDTETYSKPVEGQCLTKLFDQCILVQQLSILHFLSKEK